MIPATKGNPEKVRFDIAGLTLGQTDLKKIVFLTAEQIRLPDDAQSALRTVTVIQTGGLEIERAVLASEGARFAEIPGAMRWRIP